MAYLAHEARKDIRVWIYEVVLNAILAYVAYKWAIPLLPLRLAVWVLCKIVKYCYSKLVERPTITLGRGVGDAHSTSVETTVLPSGAIRFTRTESSKLTLCEFQII